MDKDYINDLLEGIQDMIPDELGRHNFVSKRGLLQDALVKTIDDRGFVREFPRTHVLTGHLNQDIANYLGVGGNSIVFKGKTFPLEWDDGQLINTLSSIRGHNRFNPSESNLFRSSEIDLKRIYELKGSEAISMAEDSGLTLEGQKGDLILELLKSEKYEMPCLEEILGGKSPEPSGVVSITFHKIGRADDKFREDRRKLLSGAHIDEWASTLVCEKVRGHIVTFGEYVEIVPPDQMTVENLTSQMSLSISRSTQTLEQVKPLYDTDLKLRTYAWLRGGVGLLKAHLLGILHRDIKPDNFFGELNGDHYVFKMGDFGIVKMDRDLEELANLKVTEEDRNKPGTAPYSPREAFLEKGKNMDERSDIASFGYTGFEVITGKEPFTNLENLAQVIASKLDEDGTILPVYPTMRQYIPTEEGEDPESDSTYMQRTNLSDEEKNFLENFSLIYAGCTQPNMDLRYSSMKEVVSDIGDMLEGYRPQNVSRMIEGIQIFTSMRDSSETSVQNLKEHEKREMYLKKTMKGVPAQQPYKVMTKRALRTSGCASLLIAGFIGSVYAFGANPHMGSGNNQFNLGDRIVQRSPEFMQPLLKGYQGWAKGFYDGLQKKKEEFKGDSDK